MIPGVTIKITSEPLDLQSYVDQLIGEPVELGHDREPSERWLRKTQASLSAAATHSLGRPVKIVLKWDRPFVVAKQFWIDEDKSP
jgi:hypothetical protein